MTKKQKYAFLPLRSVTEGTVLVADGGFTCMAEGAKRKVFRDRGKMTGHQVEPQMNSRSRLYVRCDEGRHYLDGQECSKPCCHAEGDTAGLARDHYVGFFLASVSRQPRPRKAARRAGL